MLGVMLRIKFGWAVDRICCVIAKKGMFLDYAGFTRRVRVVPSLELKKHLMSGNFAGGDLRPHPRLARCV